MDRHMSNDTGPRRRIAWRPWRFSLRAAFLSFVVLGVALATNREYLRSLAQRWLGEDQEPATREGSSVEHDVDSLRERRRAYCQQLEELCSGQRDVADRLDLALDANDRLAAQQAAVLRLANALVDKVIGNGDTPWTLGDACTCDSAELQQTLTQQQDDLLQRNGYLVRHLQAAVARMEVAQARTKRGHLGVAKQCQVAALAELRFALEDVDDIESVYVMGTPYPTLRELFRRAAHRQELANLRTKALLRELPGLPSEERQRRLSYASVDHGRATLCIEHILYRLDMAPSRAEFREGLIGVRQAQELVCFWLQRNRADDELIAKLDDIARALSHATNEFYSLRFDENSP